MADDASQVTTTTQDASATDQPIIQSEQPKAEEQPTEPSPTQTPAEEKPTPIIEEPKPEPVPQTPLSDEAAAKSDELPKEEEQKPSEESKPAEETKSNDKPVETPAEEPKPEEKPKEDVKPEPEKTQPPQTPQINLDELRAKANKERQDRKQEHLSEVEKLAKSKSINNDDVRELLHVSQSTATNYLEELTKQGKLKKSGKAKGTTYS